MIVTAFGSIIAATGVMQVAHAPLNRTRIRVLGNGMEDLVFIRAVEWLVRAGAEAGISVKDMLRLLNAGVSVDTRARPHRAESSGFQRGKCPLFSLGHVAVSASGVRVLTLRVEGAVGKRSTTEVLSPMQKVPVMR